MADWNSQLINLASREPRRGPRWADGRPAPPGPHTKGAKSGEPREAVLTFSRDDGRYVVCATAGGSPTTPSWYYNLLSNPAVQVEAKGETFTATASVAAPGERARLWDQHVAERPEFAEYPEKSGRTIPVVTLQRIA